mgnify:CR=1 FL=1
MTEANTKIVRGDLLSINDRHLRGANAIIHLAASTDILGQTDWNELIHVNVTGTAHLCRLAANNGIPIIIAGSAKEYGLSSDQHDFIPSDTPLRPVTPYAASKAAGHVIAESICLSNNNKTIYLRIFNAFGPGQHPASLWPSMQRAAKSGADFLISSGAQIRDFIEVEKVAKCLVSFAEHQDEISTHNSAFNIGSGQPLSVRDFCETWWQEWGAKGKLVIGAKPLRNDDFNRCVADISDLPAWAKRHLSAS